MKNMKNETKAIEYVRKLSRSAAAAIASLNASSLACTTRPASDDPYTFRIVS